MFKLDPDPRFTASVSVQVPVDGGFETQPFKATFRVLGTKETAAYDFESPESSTAFLRAAFVGFDEVTAVDGEPMQFSDRTRDALIDLPFVRVALTGAYFGAVQKVKLGN